MIASMDRNGDGTISPDEVDQRRAGYIGQRFQIDFINLINIKVFYTYVPFVLDVCSILSERHVKK